MRTLTLLATTTLALCSCARPMSQVMTDAVMMSAPRPTMGAYARPTSALAPSAAASASASGATRAAAGPSPADPPRYMILGGDLHCHISPPDQPPHVTRGPAETVELAHSEGLDFVVLTPHIGARFFQSARERAFVISSLAKLKRDINEAHPGNTLFITGIEYTDHNYGHVGVMFADIEHVLSEIPLDEAAKTPERFFEEIIAEGGVLIVNHPLVTPLDSFIPMARANLSWRPFTASGPFPPEILAVNRLAQGYEAYNLTVTHLRDRYLLGDTNRTLNATLRRLDDEIIAQGRRMAPVGGSDSHSSHLRATTFVLSEGRSESAIRDALREGRICVRDPAACSLEARAPGGNWVTVGGSLARAESVIVRAQGEDIDFVVNGEAREHLRRTGEAKIDLDSSQCSVIRARVDDGYSAPIYANCPFAEPARTSALVSSSGHSS